MSQVRDPTLRHALEQLSDTERELVRQRTCCGADGPEIRRLLHRLKRFLKWVARGGDPQQQMGGDKQ
jgi:hypothetical protein